MPLKVIPKDTTDVSEIITNCEKLLQSVETLYKTKKDKNVFDAIISLRLTKQSLELL